MENSTINKEESFSVGTILAKAKEIYLEKFKDILLIVLIINLPASIISNLQLSQFLDAIDTDPYADSFADPFAGLETSMIILILAGLFSIIGTMATIYIAKETIKKQNIDYIVSLKKAFSRYLPFIGTSILVGLALIPLYLLFIIPGLIFSVYWIFVPTIVILNDLSGVKAMKHSKQIVKGRWRKTIWYSFVISFLGYLAAFLLAFVLDFLLYFIPNIFIQNVITNTAIAVIYAYFLIASTVMYLNFEATQKKVESKK